MNKRRKKINAISNIFMCCTLIGSIGVGVIFALSEIVYDNIVSFFSCPLWYQLFTWVSVFVSICGVVGCAFYKDQKNTKSRDLYIISTMAFLCIILGTFAFNIEQSIMQNIFLWIFSFSLPISFFFFWTILIGLCRKPFEQKVVEGYIKKRCMSDYNAWNRFIQDQNGFNYDNALFPQKLSFLTYQLYSNAASGSGFEGFFNVLEYELFTKSNIKKILFRDNFFSAKLKKLICQVLNDYNKDNREELYAQYEKCESLDLFGFESELFNACVWLSCNEWILGFDTLTRAMPNVQKFYLSKDYMKRILISKNENLFTYKIEDWIFNSEDNFSGNWCEITYTHSYYDSVENLINDIQNTLQDFIEIK